MLNVTLATSTYCHKYELFIELEIFIELHNGWIVDIYVNTAKPENNFVEDAVKMQATQLVQDIVGCGGQPNSMLS